jgi:hypothetical protein
MVLRPWSTGRAVFWADELGIFIQDQVQLHPNLQMSLGDQCQWAHFDAAIQFVGRQSAIAKDCYEGATHSMRKARTGSMEAARRAGMMPAMAAVITSTPMAMVMTGTFTLVVS